MDNEPQPTDRAEPIDDDLADDDVADEPPIPLDADFEVPVVDAIEQHRAVVLDDDHREHG